MQRHDKNIRLTRSVICFAEVAALIVLFGLGPSIAMSQDTTEAFFISVVDADSGDPVPSMIVTFPPDPAGTPQAETDEQGELSMALECSGGMRIQARPGAAYFPSRKLFCDSSSTHMTFAVTAIRVGAMLRRNLERAVEAEWWGVAAHLANELSWIENGDSQGVAGDEAARLAYEYSARQLELEVDESVVFDTLQGKDVMAPELRSAIVVFQRRLGITENGQLDYLTLYNMSGMASSALRHRPFPVPIGQ